MTINKDELIAFGVIAGWAATLAYSINANLKLKKTNEYLGFALEDFVHENIREIPQETIECAVNRAVDSRYQALLTRASNEAVKATRNDMEKKIANAVNHEFEKQKDGLVKELKYRVGVIDISEIREEVIKEAKEEAAKKFSSDLDSVANKYNEQLDQISTIYSTIASKMKGE